jgi:hypothetical protein
LPDSWIDKTLVNWNQPGAEIPTAPTSEFGGISDFCREIIRKPSTEADKALIAAGWQLVNAVQIYNDTAIVTAATGADGMCRPLGFQEFVFVNNQFAGTLSPVPMNSRSDSSLITAYSPNFGT